VSEQSGFTPQRVGGGVERAAMKNDAKPRRIIDVIVDAQANEARTRQH
jgi:hypothetical protein